jgi:hypothetical protein
MEPISEPQRAKPIRKLRSYFGAHLLNVIKILGNNIP